MANIYCLIISHFVCVITGIDRTVSYPGVSGPVETVPPLKMTWGGGGGGLMGN